MMNSPNTTSKDDPAPLLTTASSKNANERIKNARKALRDATEKTLRISSTETAMKGTDGVISSTGNVPSNCTGDDDANLESPQKSRNDESLLTSPIRARPDRESYELGMHLFGGVFSEGGEGGVLENEIDMRISEVESEIESILRSSSEAPAGDMEDSDGIEKPEDSMDIEEEDNKEDNPVAISHEALILSEKSKFLRGCANIRSLVSSSFSSQHNLLESAKLLSQAKESLKQTETFLPHSSVSTISPKEKEVAHLIVSSIETSIRRCHVDLQSRASKILDESIQMSADGITVRELDDSMDEKSIGMAFAVLDILDENVLHDAIHLLSTNLSKILCMLLEEDEDPNNSDRKNDKMISPSWQFRQIKSGDVENEMDNASNNRFGVSKSSASIPTVTLKWRRRTSSSISPELSDPKTCNSSSVATVWGETLHAVQTVLTFTHDFILIRRDDLCAKVGKYLFRGNKFPINPSDMFALKADDAKEEGYWEGPILKKLLTKIRNCVPKTPIELDTLGPSLLSITQEFDQEMLHLSFYPPEASEDMISTDFHSPLSSFTSDFPRRYAEKRRTTILSEARTILLKQDYHNTLTVGEECSNSDHRIDPPSHILTEDIAGSGIFSFPLCSVSSVSSSILSLLRCTLDEAAEVSSLFPNTFRTLYRTSRELLDLFRAIIPSAHGNILQNMPRAAAVWHNDCCYMANVCLTLGLELKNKHNDNGEDGLTKFCTYLDFVPVFREIANQSLGSMLTLQKTQILTLVNPRILKLGISLRISEAITEWTDAETAIRAGQYHLHHLSQSWKPPILGRDVYGRSMGNLVDTLFCLLLDQVLKEARDISEPACHFLSELFRTTIQKTSNLFLDGEKEAREYCNLWERFFAVGRFMDMSLVDISAALSEGVFRSVTAPELTRLIVAVFEDSERRRGILRVLSSVE